MSRKVNANLVAVGSAAIVTLYALGYARTQSAGHPPAAANVSAATPAAAGGSPGAAPSAAATASPVPDTPTAIARLVATTPRPATPAPTPAATVGQRYRDGTYSGSGSSRRGDIAVALTVQNGQISNVRITRSTTYYPTSAIARLPGEVVARQSAQVDFVSGATESSRAFRGAVTQALTQASAATSAG